MDQPPCLGHYQHCWVLPDSWWRDEIFHVSSEFITKLSSIMLFYKNLMLLLLPCDSACQRDPLPSHRQITVSWRRARLLFVPPSRSPHKGGPQGDHQEWQHGGWMWIWEPQTEREFIALFILAFFLSQISASVFILWLIDCNGGKLLERGS